jgi:ATP-binding cassette, subfamily F, member 1
LRARLRPIGSSSAALVALALSRSHSLSTPAHPQAAADKEKVGAGVSLSLSDLRGGKGGGKKGGGGAGAADGGGKAAKPAGRGPPPPKATKGSDSYLGDLDLPSSDSETDGSGDESRAFTRDEKADVSLVSCFFFFFSLFFARCTRVPPCSLSHPLTHPSSPSPQATERDAKRIAERERKAAERAAREKAAALADDDNVFDVSFEGSGGGAGGPGGSDAVGGAVSATDIKVHNLTIRAKGKILLEGASLTVTAGRRYGLVGPNGKGKSTLLRMIARRQVPVPDTLDVLLVEQEVVGDSTPALQAVVAADTELMALRAEEEELTAVAAGEGPEADAAGARLAEIYDRLEDKAAGSAEARASKILHGLGFTQAMQARATADFSGGWRMRISLARALYIAPTLLLLDEPTNHLDLRAVLWLEEYLTRWKKTLIVVSHDRGFLNAITTDIVHLHDERLHYYRGNFEQFEEMYDQRRREVNKVADKFDKAMRAAKRSGGKAAQDKVVKGAAAQAKGKKGKKGGRGGDDDDDDGGAGGGAAALPRRWTDYTVTFTFPPPTDLPTASLLQLVDADFQYPGRSDFALSGLNIGVDMGTRVAIVGPNGAGKTTLMNLLAGDLTPTAGEQRRSHSLRVGRYAQHFVDALQMDDTPVEYLMRRFPTSGLRPEQMRAQLGRFGLAGHHHLQPICKLSGGQKARVVFTAISLANPHILLLDEPTNHLDMQSIDALGDAVEAFEGGVIVISHDAQLLERVCADETKAQVWVVEDGKVAAFDGDFEDYREGLVKEIAAEMEEDDAAAAAAEAAARARRAQSLAAKKGGGSGSAAPAAPAPAAEPAFVNPLISNPSLLAK